MRADRLADRRVARDLDLEDAPPDTMGVLPSGISVKEASHKDCTDTNQPLGDCVIHTSRMPIYDWDHQKGSIDSTTHIRDRTRVCLVIARLQL